MPTTTTPLAELAIDYPDASRVFRDLGLDYCCGGRRPLGEACEARGLDAGAVLELATRVRDDARRVHLAGAPLAELVDHVLVRYHGPLRTQLPELVLLAQSVERAHAAHRDCPVGLADELRALRDRLLPHLDQEEQALFPALCAEVPLGCAALVAELERDHEEYAAALRRLRARTRGFTAPADGCTSWSVLVRRLAELEADLMDHAHLENFVLFARALAR